MQVDAGLDTGPVLACEKVAIGPRMTVSDLHDELARIGAPLMVRAMHDFAAGRIAPQPQPADGVTYAAKLARDEGRIDWRSEEHTSELQSLMRISYAVFCLKKKTRKHEKATTD